MTNEKILLQQRKYRAEHKDIIKVKHAITAACDICGTVVVKRMMSRHKLSARCQNYGIVDGNSKTVAKWKPKDPEKIKQYKKQYRTEHKDIIKVKQAVKCECNICGDVVVKRMLYRHKLSEKCKSHI